MKLDFLQQKLADLKAEGLDIAELRVTPEEYDDLVRQVEERDPLGGWDKVFPGLPSPRLVLFGAYISAPGRP